MTQSKKAKRKRERGALDTDADVTPGDVDWDAPVQVDLDPALVERIRSRQKLRQITLRVGEEQIEEARRVAAETGIPYQTILRRWLAQGASLSRSVRKAG
jgi:hypothetical protein